MLRKHISYKFFNGNFDLKLWLNLFSFNCLYNILLKQINLKNQPFIFSEDLEPPPFCSNSVSYLAIWCVHLYVGNSLGFSDRPKRYVGYFYTFNFFFIFQTLLNLDIDKLTSAQRIYDINVMLSSVTHVKKTHKL
ncbi:hypothetical protein KUTeg_019611 [Tegillarca granosa]|uniref:Uncharacterized protein n=1 Tax=Tegillarca granosa TaxID=220873 RepID=A0ABQ9EDJ4_TEGGR|nr:hypothetical protein KUTeg_019611 [Tegillarca granosa]